MTDVRIPWVHMAQVGNGLGMMTECGAQRAQFSGWYLGGSDEGVGGDRRNMMHFLLVCFEDLPVVDAV